MGLGIGMAMVGLLADFLFGVPSFSLAGTGLLVAAVGFLLLLLSYPGAERAKHLRGAWMGLLAGIAAALVYPILPPFLELTGNGLDLRGFAAYEHTILGFVTLLVLLACVSVVLATFVLQDRWGRGLVLTGLASAVLIQAVLWGPLNASVDRALFAALASPFSNPFWDFHVEWARLGSLNAIPLALFLVAYERLYWQLRRRHFSGHSLLEV